MFGPAVFTMNTAVNNQMAERHSLQVFRKGAEITETLAAGGTGMFSCCMFTQAYPNNTSIAATTVMEEGLIKAFSKQAWIGPYGCF